MDNLKSFIETRLGKTIDDVNEDLIDSGILDSLEAMNLLVLLETEYKVNFSFAQYSQQGFFCLNKLHEALNSELPK